MLSALLPALLAVLPAAQRQTPPLPQPPAAVLPASDVGPSARSVARLRKLHLVRPDLIPYPLAYEVYC